MNKKQQKKLLSEIMEADARDGLYSSISKMETTQTAVEWLAIELYEKMNMSGDGTLLDSIVRVAKQMEKEQISKAWNDGNYAYFYSKETGVDFDNGEQYYNETYNK